MGFSLEFYDDVTVPSPSKRRKLEKSRKPITFVVLESVMKELSLKASSLGSETVEGIVVVTAWIEKILTDLKVQHKRVPCGKEEVSLFLTAIENSWIHLRRKKRERVRQLREVPRAPEDVIQALEEKKSTPKSLAVAKIWPRAPRRVSHAGLLYRKARLPLLRAIAQARICFPKKKTQNLWRMKGVRKREG